MENRQKNKNIDGFEPARTAILEKCLDLTPFDGWTRKMLADATAAADVDSATARAAFPGGMSDVLKYWSGLLDDEIATSATAPEFKEMRIRDKVTFLVRSRLDALRPHKESARRAAALLASPPMAALATKLTWASADRVWRALGDRSTDFNYYTKRTILSGVLTSTTARWLADNSEDEAPTDAFLAARIDNVMQIEKVKSRVRDLGIDPTAPIGWLAKLRYPSGR